MLSFDPHFFAIILKWIVHIWNIFVILGMIFITFVGDPVKILRCDFLASPNLLFSTIFTRLQNNCMYKTTVIKETFREIVKQTRCPLCFRKVDAIKMAAVPQGAFAARKIRENEEKRKAFHFNTDLTPTNYSSKYMNSIWGQYNRYSVHNLKKIMDKSIQENIGTLNLGVQNEKPAKPESTEKTVFAADFGSFGSSLSFSATISQ